jgi:hypothetical protein
MLPLLAHEVQPYLVCGEAVLEVGQGQAVVPLESYFFLSVLVTAVVSATEKAVNGGRYPRQTGSVASNDSMVAPDVSTRIVSQGRLATRSRAADHGPTIQYRRTGYRRPKPF